jgi:hypothetical protein
MWLWHLTGWSLPLPVAVRRRSPRSLAVAVFEKLSRRPMRGFPNAARVSCDFASRKLADSFAGLAKRCFAFSYCHWLLAQYLAKASKN